MKEWNKPQLASLGVENTFDVDCTCDATTFAKDPDKNTHYCHVKGEAHANNCPSWKDEVHYINDPCPGTQHWGASHDSKCCCGARGTVSPS